MAVVVPTDVRPKEATRPLRDDTPERKLDCDCARESEYDCEEECDEGDSGSSKRLNGILLLRPDFIAAGAKMLLF